MIAKVLTRVDCSMRFSHVSISVYAAHVLSIFCLYVDVLYARIRYV